jgi:calcium-dependent protein kinase
MGAMISTLCSDKSQSVLHNDQVARKEDKYQKMDGKLTEEKPPSIVFEKLESTEAKPHHSTLIPKLRKTDSLILPSEKACISEEAVKKRYSFVQDIDNSNFGKVYKATMNGRQGEDGLQKMFAIKLLNKRINSSQVSHFLYEIEFMKALDHPNIVKFFECYESQSNMYIVEEYLEGGTLGQRFAENMAPFSESSLKSYLFQILLAVNFLHLRGILHRDIRPENFILVDSSTEELKLIDFGNAVIVDDFEKFNQPSGCLKFSAPEVLKKSYGKKADVWSVGVIMYYFMTAAYPFEDDDSHVLEAKIEAVDYDRSAITKSEFSDNAKELVFKLLEPDSTRRLTALQALRHPFFADRRKEIMDLGEKCLNAQMFENLRVFHYNTTMQREMRALIVQSLPTAAPEVQKIVNVFNYMDQDFSGSVSAREIEAIYEKFNIKLRDGEIEEIIDSLYFKEKALVTYLEFIAATLDKEFYRNKQRIRELFNYMDVDLSGEIDYKDIQECFKRFGRLLDDSKIKRMISECDNNRDGKISFEEFYDIIVAERIRQA